MTGASVGMGLHPCLSPDGIYAEGLLYIEDGTFFIYIYTHVYPNAPCIYLQLPIRIA